MERKLWQEVELLARRNGYQSRTQFLTALVTAAVRGVEESEKKYGHPIPDTAKDWIADNTSSLSEGEIRKKLDSIIEDMLQPVIAMKGAEMACELALSDVRSTFHDDTGIWLTEGEIKSAIEEYELLNSRRLMEFRENTLSGRNEAEEEP